MFVFFFFFYDTSTSEIYTLSLHDALPICGMRCAVIVGKGPVGLANGIDDQSVKPTRSEEHTSELQSLRHLVCRLLLEKKKKKKKKKKLNAHNHTHTSK